jgi:hypothetical protein
MRHGKNIPPYILQDDEGSGIPLLHWSLTSRKIQKYILEDVAFRNARLGMSAPQSH